MILLALFEHPLALEEAVNNLVRQEALGQFRIISYRPPLGTEPKLVLPNRSISAGVDPQPEGSHSAAQDNAPLETSLEDLEQQLSNHFSPEQLRHAVEQIEEGKPALLLRTNQAQKMTQLLGEVGAIEVITGG